jgi:hypothetical protein
MCEGPSFLYLFFLFLALSFLAAASPCHHCHRRLKLHTYWLFGALHCGLKVEILCSSSMHSGSIIPYYGYT